jgi:hypothetical protein
METRPPCLSARSDPACRGLRPIADERLHGGREVAPAGSTTTAAVESFQTHIARFEPVLNQPSRVEDLREPNGFERGRQSAFRGLVKAAVAPSESFKERDRLSAARRNAELRTCEQ